MCSTSCDVVGNTDWVPVGGEESGYLVFLLLRLSINKYITFKTLAFICPLFTSGIFTVEIPFCGKSCCGNTV